MAPRRKPPIERFNAKTSPGPNGCIEWTGDKGNSGYGRFWIGPENSRKALAHRWSYEYHVGPIPDGLVIDHLCRNKICVNPKHLEPVTASENVRRGVSAERIKAAAEARTHCRRGHEYTEENTGRRASRPRERFCKECRVIARKADYEANRQRYIDNAAKWRRENPERYREQARLGAARYRARKKAEENKESE